MVAGAVRYLAKAILTGSLSLISDKPQEAREVGGRPVIAEDIGERIITNSQLLAGIPGMNRKTIQQQLANLKTSGEYARLMREVEEAFAREPAPRGNNRCVGTRRVVYNAPKRRAVCQVETRSNRPLHSVPFEKADYLVDLYDQHDDLLDRP